MNRDYILAIVNAVQNKKLIVTTYTSIKNNCLKLKNEVGMAVLKSKQTRVV